MAANELPVPPHYNPQSVSEVWKVPYQERADEAEGWAGQHKLQPAFRDTLKISLLLVDVQNTFCIPDFELYVGGTTGTGAVDDNRRLCDFVYRNLNVITEICPTMDTHQAMQIFHGIFLTNDAAPFTLITEEDIAKGVWKFNPQLAASLQIDEVYGQKFLRHYTRQLKDGGKYDLTIWPYHAMLGGIGHALVSAVEEAVFFHSIARLGSGLLPQHRPLKPAGFSRERGQSLHRELLGSQPGSAGRPRRRGDC
jgi:nicotinamidase-related amidase